MKSLLSLLVFPMTILNLMGGIGSAVWLAVIGKWNFIGAGLLAAVVSSALIPFVLRPNLLLAIPAQSLIQKGSVPLGAPLLILSQSYIYAVIIAWCMSVFYFSMREADPSTFLPLLFGSYWVSLSPLRAISRRESQAGMDASTMTTMFAQLGFIAVIVCAIFFRPPFRDLVVVFSLMILLGLVIQTGTALAAISVEARIRTGIGSHLDPPRENILEATESVAATKTTLPVNTERVPDRAPPHNYHPATNTSQARNSGGSVEAVRQREALDFKLYDFVTCERYGPGQIKAVNPTAKVLLIEFKTVGAPMPMSVGEANAVGLRVVFRPG